MALSGEALVVPQQTRVMTEYRYAPLDYYFMTSRDGDKTLLDAVSGWARRSASTCWLPRRRPRGISRYYFDQVARGQRGSHFYTLVEPKTPLAGLNPEQPVAPACPPQRGCRLYAFAPLVGALAVPAHRPCPVYRLFRGNANFPNDPNHRFTTSLAIYKPVRRARLGRRRREVLRTCAMMLAVPSGSYRILRVVANAARAVAVAIAVSSAVSLAQAAVIGDAAPSFALSGLCRAPSAWTPSRSWGMDVSRLLGIMVRPSQSFPWMNDARGTAAAAHRRVSVDTRTSDAEKFRQQPASFTIAYDTSGDAPRRYAVKAMPTSLLIDPAGRVVLVHAGFKTEDRAALEDAIRNALSRTAAIAN